VAAVAIDDLTITHGRADNGGDIWNAGTLTVSHSVFSDNQAPGEPEEAGQGGAFSTGPAPP
jgi:hypothetical protein